MSAAEFLSKLDLNEEETKLLVSSVFMSNLLTDEEEEGPYSELAEAWDSLLVKVLHGATESKLYGAKDAEQVLVEELNENEELEGLMTSYRTRVFWEELVSHLVGREIEVRKIDLADDKAIDDLYKEMDELVQTKGLDALKG